MSEKYPKTLFNVALIHPEIPNNTGNIGRTCVGLWSKLHLVGPMGFAINDKKVKRAGLDYWPHLDLTEYSSWNEFESILPRNRERIFLFETGGHKSLYEAEFQPGDWLLFGKETKGIPGEIREELKDRIFTIPFMGQIRSFNLANTVSMVMSEGHRQLLALDSSAR